MSEYPDNNPFVKVFSNKYYLVLAVSIAAVFWILLNVLDQLLFFWPGLIFYLPREKMPSFVLSTLTSAILGTVIPMNIYSISRSWKRKKVNATLLPGTTFAVASCACAGCSSIGLALLPTFGSIGAIGIAFFAEYQELLRTISLGILFWSLISIYRQIKLPT